MAEQFTAKFSVDISDLKKNIDAANKAIKNSSAVFKNETAGMDKWSASAEGLAAKLKQLKTNLESQKSILSSYQEQLKRQQDAYDENGRRAEELKAKLQSLAQNGVAKTDEEYQKYEKALKAVLKEHQNNAKAVDDLKGKVLDQSTAIKTTEAAIKKYTTAEANLEKENNSLSATIKKQESDLAKLKSEYADVVAAEGKNSASAKALASQITALSTDVKKNKQTMADAESASDKLDKSLDDLGKSADKTGGKFDCLGAKIANGLKNGLIAAGTAAASAVAALTGATVSAASFADEIKTLSTVTGMSTESLQAYNYAAELVDVSMETLTGSMAKNIKSMSSAADGSKKYAEAYAALGVSVTDADGKLRDGETVYWEVIDALGKMDEGAERDALAMDLFGKSAQDLNPLIQQGSEGIAKLTDEAREMGAIMSDDAIDSLGNFDDAMQRLKGGASAAKNALGTILLPQLQLLADDGTKLLSEFTDGINGANGDWSKIGDVIGATVGKLADKILEELPKFIEVGGKILEGLAKAVIENIPKVASTLISLASKLIEKLPKLADMGVRIILTLLDGLTQSAPELLKQIASVVSKVVSTLVKHAPQLLEGAIQFFLAIVDALPEILNELDLPGLVTEITEALIKATPILISALFQITIAVTKAVFEMIRDNFIPTIIGAFSGLWNGIKEVFAPVGEWVKLNVIQPVGDFFAGMWQRLSDGAKAAWDGIKSIFGGITNWFKDKFSAAWKAVKDVFSAGGKVFDGIKDGIVNAFKVVVNAIIRGINKVISVPFDAINGVLKKLKSIEILGITPFYWVKTFTTPQIPELAKGGVLRRGQVGLLEGDGTEAVVPLERNKQWIKAVANDLLNDLRIGAGVGGAVTTSNFTQIINAPKQPSRIELYRQTKNLLAYAQAAGV